MVRLRTQRDNLKQEWARLSLVTDQAGRRRKRAVSRKLAVVTRKLRHIRLRRTRIIAQRFKRREPKCGHMEYARAGSGGWGN